MSFLFSSNLLLFFLSRPHTQYIHLSSLFRVHFCLLEAKATYQVKIICVIIIQEIEDACDITEINVFHFQWTSEVTKRAFSWSKHNLQRDLFVFLFDNYSHGAHHHVGYIKLINIYRKVMIKIYRNKLFLLMWFCRKLFISKLIKHDFN